MYRFVSGSQWLSQGTGTCRRTGGSEEGATNGGIKGERKGEVGERGLELGKKVLMRGRRRCGDRRRLEEE